VHGCVSCEAQPPHQNCITIEHAGIACIGSTRIGYKPTADLICSNPKWRGRRSELGFVSLAQDFLCDLFTTRTTCVVESFAASSIHGLTGSIDSYGFCASRYRRWRGANQNVYSSRLYFTAVFLLMRASEPFEYNRQVLPHILKRLQLCNGNCCTSTY
jgi:hypothetical protein